MIDKTPPEVAWLNPVHAAALKNPKVKFTSANLITPREYIFSTCFNPT